MSKVIVVGAGLAGLTAGIYARRSGFETEIYESHTLPGGASSSWQRGGYWFEGGVHWMTGSSPKTPLNRLWREVGALDDSIKVYNGDPFSTIEYNGQRICIYRDVEKLRSHLLSLAPEDTVEINRLCTDIDRFTKVTMPVTNLRGVRLKHKQPSLLGALPGMLPAFARMPFYAKQTTAQYAARFQSPLLQLFVKNVAGEENSAVAMLFTLATLAAGDGGYPAGGSLTMPGRMAKRFETLGGTLHYGKKVEKIIVENGAACGIVVDGQTIPAHAVIVTQDTRMAIDTLFDPPIDEPWAQQMRAETVPTMNTFIALGVQADLSQLPEKLLFPAGEEFVCGGLAQPFVSINNYARYKGYAPEGCTALTSIISGDSYDYWKACKENGTYRQEKQKLAEHLISILEKRFPEITGKVAVWDVATPLTYERYLHSYKGSWMSDIKPGRMKSYPSKPQSIRNVYFAGQRVSPPGGMPVALDTGRRAVQYLCRDAGTVFEANT